MVKIPTVSSTTVNTPNPIFSKWPKNKRLFRIYDPAKNHSGPVAFRYFGPLSRFDHHRGKISQPPNIIKIPHNDGSFEEVESFEASRNTRRGILYCGETLSCCIVEIFGDMGAIADRHFVEIRPCRDLKLLDLRGNGAMRIGANASISKSLHVVSQEWSRHIYEDAIFRNVDGIIYLNAHNDEVALALYERVKNSLAVMSDIPLSHISLRTRLINAADEAGLFFVPNFPGITSP